MLLMSLLTTLSLADPASPASDVKPPAQSAAIYDIVPTQLPPSRTRCSLSTTADGGDHQEFAWDPMSSAQATHRVVLLQDADYRLACVGEMLPLVSKPIDGMTYAMRWHGSGTFKTTGASTTATFAGGAATCTTKTHGYVTCAPKNITLSVTPWRPVSPTSVGFVEASGVRDVVAFGDPARVVAAERALGLDSTVLADRLMGLAADIVVTEVRQAGMESLKERVRDTLGCKDPSWTTTTCEVLDALTLEQLLEDRNLLQRAVMVDLAQGATEQIAAGPKKRALALIAVAAIAVLVDQAGVEFDLTSLARELDGNDYPELKTAFDILKSCEGVQCSGSTLDRLVSLLAVGSDGSEVAALVVALDRLLHPSAGRSDTQRVRDAIALMRVAYPEKADAKMRNALAVLDALVQGDMSSAARAALSLVDPGAVPKELRLLIGLAVAVGAATVELRRAGSGSDEQWKERSKDYKQAILAWMRGQRSRHDRRREAIVSVGGTLSLEMGASWKRNERDSMVSRVVLPLEVGLDFFAWKGQSVRFAFSPVDVGAYALPLLGKDAEDSSIADRLVRAQRTSASVGWVFRGGRVPPSVTLTTAYQPREGVWFVGVRTGFLVPFADRRVLKW